MISGKAVEVGHLVGKLTSDNARLKGILNTTSGVLSGKVERYIAGGDADIYDGEYIITPIPYDDQVLETKEKLMTDNVTVLAIPYYETSNISGITVYIGGE